MPFLLYPNLSIDFNLSMFVSLAGKDNIPQQSSYELTSILANKSPPNKIDTTPTGKVLGGDTTPTGKVS